MEDRGQLRKSSAQRCTSLHIVLEEVGNDKFRPTSHDVPQRPIYPRLLSAYILDPASSLMGSHNISDLQDTLDRESATQKAETLEQGSHPEEEKPP